MKFKVGDIVGVAPQARRWLGHRRGIVVGKGPIYRSHRVFWFSQCITAAVSANDLVKAEVRGEYNPQ